MAVEKNMPILVVDDYRTMLRIVKRDFIQMPLHGLGVEAGQNEVDTVGKGSMTIRHFKQPPRR